MNSSATLWPFRLVILLAIGIGVFMSWPLWQYHASFPMFPFISLPSYVGEVINNVGVYLLIGFLVLSLLFPSRISALSLFVISSLLIAQDQLRLQPWFYMYLLLLIPVLYYWQQEQHAYLKRYCQLVIAGVYFWSGIHKIHPNFFELVLKPILQFYSGLGNSFWINKFSTVSYLVPVLELSVGLSFVFLKWVQTAKKVVVVMHILLIIYLSPLGIAYNYVVIPWNVAMIFLVLKLYFIKRPVLLVGLLLVWFMPFLNFFGKWDYYPSFSLYSSKPKSYFVKISSNDLKKKPRLNSCLAYGLYNNDSYLNLNSWCLLELNVPFYPQERLVAPLRKWLKTNNFVEQEVLSCPAQKIDCNCQKME